MSRLNSEKSFFAVLPIVNGILSLLIVAHHSSTMDVGYNATVQNFAWAFERYIYNLSECAVPIFFFISGMLFYRDYQNCPGDYRKKIGRRITSLVIPYFIFNILGYVKHILLGGGRYHPAGFLISVCRSETMPLWFLRELFILCLLAPIIYAIKRRKVIVVGVTVLIFSLVAVGVIPYRSFFYWLPIYVCGANFSPDCFQRIQDNIKKNISTCILAIGVYLVLVWFLPNTTSKMNSLGNIVFYLFRIYSVVVFVVIISFFIGRTYPMVGNYSFWVYCVHFPVISLYQKLLNRVLPQNRISVELIKYFSTIMVGYIVCILLAHILRACCPRIYKILNGGRI